MPKARFELRIDEGLHAHLRTLADASSVSMTQLMEGILAWAASNAHPGIPEPDDNGRITTAPGPGIWFGRDGYDAEGHPVGQPLLVFALDFSAARSVRDAREYLP